MARKSTRKISTFCWGGFSWISWTLLKIQKLHKKTINHCSSSYSQIKVFVYIIKGSWRWFASKFQLGLLGETLRNHTDHKTKKIRNEDNREWDKCSCKKQYFTVFTSNCFQLRKSIYQWFSNIHARIANIHRGKNTKNSNRYKEQPEKVSGPVKG